MLVLLLFYYSFALSAILPSSFSIILYVEVEVKWKLFSESPDSYHGSLICIQVIVDPPEGLRVPWLTHTLLLLQQH